MSPRQRETRKILASHNRHTCFDYEKRRSCVAAKKGEQEDMQQRTIGQSGLRVSAVGLGCNNIGRLLDLEHSRDLESAVDRHDLAGAHHESIPLSHLLDPDLNQ